VGFRKEFDANLKWHTAAYAAESMAVTIRALSQRFVEPVACWVD
jgi:hypothetical protein